MAEWKQNLPHIIALALLLFALLVVLTRVGLVGCSTFGAGYCDIYYSMFGRPQIAIVYDPSGPGIGDPTALARYLEDEKHFNVREITVDQLSAGMLDKYDVVIVEHARDIPTSKLKLFYDYVINGMGRLVWVGDSGADLGMRDTLCRTIDYTVQWRAEQGTKQVEKTKKVCITPGDVGTGNQSVSEFALEARSALYQKAWSTLAEMCHDAFGGNLQHIKYAKGYPCMGTTGYEEVYFNWINEGDFKQVVSPWDRGEFKLLGQQVSSPGIHFGRDVLGVTFISDAYSVGTYTRFATQIKQLKSLFDNAHEALLNCTSSSCDYASISHAVESAREQLQDEIRDVKIKLSSDISELQSIEQSEKAGNQTTQALRIQGIINVLLSAKDNISADNLTFLDEARSKLLSAAGYESDDTLKSQLLDLANRFKSYKSNIESKALALSEAESELKRCPVGGALSNYAKNLGIPQEKLFVLATLSNQPSDDDLIDFIVKVRSGYFDDVLDKLNADKTCGASKYFAQAIELAKSLKNPAQNNSALAVLKVEDPEHPLVYGIAQSISLEDKYGNPVPFVLVATGNEYTHVVASLEITPAYKGEKLWPAITVRDPKYGSHIFGRGVVVYYAFPPEISPVLVSNLVKFILY